MTYELAEQLKDAGFPQHESNVRYDGTRYFKQDGEYVFNPTLEELIEACGVGFANLEREDEGPEEGGVQWIAFSNLAEGEGGTGKDPLTAVARLWLVLNKPLTDQGVK